MRQHKTENNGNSIFFVHFYQLFLCYLFYEYPQAVESSILAAGHVNHLASTPSVPLYYFYSSLARLATYLESNTQSQSKIFEEVAVNQEKMQQWAHYTPINHLHKYYLVEAEKARILGQWFEAEELYEQAIRGARDHDLQEEALAYELAAKFYLARGREKFAQTYMKEAHYCYERWGATTKVKDLETRYSQFFPQSSPAYTPSHKTSGITSNRSPFAFDLATVMKALQAISSEIELEQLLRVLMKMSIENSEAQSGFLLLENSGEWVIEASGKLSNDENIHVTQVLQSIPTENHLPSAIIQYVIRTHEFVILHDAIHEGDFINEPYIQHRQTQSILCMPLLNQGNLVGILYLENQLVARAFTPDRSSFLNLLSTQAAIAIENARLISKLRASESQMAQFLEAVPLGIGVVDTLGRPYYANQQAIQLLGKGIAPVTSDRMEEVYQLYLAGTDRPYPIENLPVMRALSGERTRIDDLEIHQHNITIPVEGWGTPIFDEQGNVIYAISFFQDITERKRAEAQLVKSETLLRTIVQSEPECVKLIAADGTLLDMNPAGLAMIEADSLEQLQGKAVDLIMVEKYRVALQALTKRIFQGESGVLEFEIVGLKGTHRWLEMHSVPLRDENQAITALLAVTRDITEHKQTEQLLAEYNQTLEWQVAERTQELEREQAALKQSESTNRAMISAIPDLLIQMSQDGTYLKVVRSENFVPFTQEQLKVGANVRDVMPPSLAQMQMEYTQQAIQTGELQVYEQKIVSEDEVFNQEVRIVATGNSEVLVIIRDIRERKQAEEASILEERNRMAREIHDTLAQAFTSIIVHLDAAAQRITLDPDSAQSHMKTGRALARSGLADARRSVEALRPQILEEGDLHSALARLASQMFSPTLVQVVCKAIGDPYVLSKEVETNLLRIGQEALNNAFKYAHASEIRIELRYELSQCVLQIKDNGQGFETTGLSVGRGFGLLGMSERAERIGASLTIRSHLGQGTEIVVGVKMP